MIVWAGVLGGEERLCCFEDGEWMNAQISYDTFFAEWKCWKEFEPRFDGLNGVYAFRLKKAFSRLKGKSQIVYIGKCEQNPDRKNPGLWYRLNNYRQDLDGGSERLKRLIRHKGGEDKIEYAYVVCDNPRGTEKALLEDYFKRHLELPPLNRAG